MSEETREVVLITGSNGYLGYAVAKRLADSYTVVGLDRRQPSHPPPAAECLYTDLTSEPSLRRALLAVRDIHGERLASVIHFAAYYDFSGSPSPLYEKVTVRGTERLLRLLAELFQVEQFIFSSSMLVHAPTRPGVPLTEDAPLLPTWPYPQSKARTEQVIHAQRGDIPVVILRIAGVYDDLGHSIPLPRQIQRIFERDPLARVFPGDLSHGQSFVHRKDIVDLYVSLLGKRLGLPPDLTLLIGEPETLSYGELQEQIGWLLWRENSRTRPVPKRLARLGARLMNRLPLGGSSFYQPWMIDRADDHYELDIGRAQTTLGWEPKHRLARTLPQIIAALQADPWAWYRENELPAPTWLKEIAPEPLPLDLEEGAAHHLMRLRERGLPAVLEEFLGEVGPQNA
jgi:nucleoside-diphosphate-sugar epimerase